MTHKTTPFVPSQSCLPLKRVGLMDQSAVLLAQSKHLEAESQRFLNWLSSAIRNPESVDMREKSEKMRGQNRGHFNTKLKSFWPSTITAHESGNQTNTNGAPPQLVDFRHSADRLNFTRRQENPRQKIGSIRNLTTCAQENISKAAIYFQDMDQNPQP
jgi:hypothetical protein